MSIVFAGKFIVCEWFPVLRGMPCWQRVCLGGTHGSVWCLPRWNICNRRFNHVQSMRCRAVLSANVQCVCGLFGGVIRSKHRVVELCRLPDRKLLWW